MFVIYGLLLIGLGFLVVLKSEWLLINFGRIAWFEKQFGAEGGSRLGYKLLGLLVIFFGLLEMTGSLSSFMGFVLSPLIQR
ncbi:MAG: hypothetical protein WCK37_03365 [Candidatus Falkowbacteria bacterium]